ncbi:MAG: tRNA 4-thiouridine(8) synthase ThiI [Planctomycetes bacterium]|nr:tRNA 4-thiouridine(8) synthase ThiI [Planctomycetota bacterium]
MNVDAALIRFGEIGLKGNNRHEFLARFGKNLRIALEPYPGATVEELQGRFLAELAGHGVPALEALSRVCGVTSVSPAVRVAADLAALEPVVAAAAAEALRERRFATFRIKGNRADKSFKVPSMELERKLGAVVLAAFPALRVDLEHPDWTLGVEVRPEGAFVHHGRIVGPGGLPVGSLGNALALLSGGIDSPVAAWLAMKRGLRLDGVFFHSAEYTGFAATEKVKELARLLSRYAPRFGLHLVPFGPIQAVIKEACDPSYRTLLYRRMMHRIAVAVAARERCSALVTGDNLGQVASQTLENLALTAAASELPLLRPLLTFDKEETIALAKRIGTFDVSIRPALDCCTVFQPAHPRIRGDADQLAREEELLPMDALVEAAMRQRELWVFHHGRPGRQIELPPRANGAG